MLSILTENKRKNNRRESGVHVSKLYFLFCLGGENNMFREDATEIARKIREGERTAKEYVFELIEKIKHENSDINAVIHERFEEALQESEHSNFKEKPFDGVPILLKGLSQPIKDMPQTSASRLFQNSVAKHSNYFVQRLLDAGFIVVGQTNIPEFGFKNVTDSKMYGDAKNPFDTKRTAGGSSGGSGAALGAGWLPLAGASDGGGSIRIPASYNGLIGLKPSRGRIVVGPGDMRSWGGAAIPFVLTKSVRDTIQLLYILEGNQPEAPYNLSPLKTDILEKSIDFTKLKIGFTTKSPVGSHVSADAVAAVKKAVQYFEKKGASVEESTPIYDGVELMHAYYAMNGAETAAMMEKIEQSLKRPLTPDDMEPMTWAIYQYGKKLTAADYIQAFAKWDEAAKVMTDYHRSYDLYLTPTTAEVAPLLSTKFQSDELVNELQMMDQQTKKEKAKQLVYEMFEKSLAVTPFTQLANLTGQPAISLPIYKNLENLPLGIQLMALKGEEKILLQVAKQMETDGLFG